MRKILDGVFAVGIADPHRRVFDALVPLPRGTTYNSYVVFGSTGTALIDTMEPEHLDAWFENLEACGVTSVDWIVSNHAEQDHSGGLPAALERFPGATLLCTPKARGVLLDHLALPEARIRTVADGETVSLGDRTLEFLHAPWVHWPETMLTWLREDRVLFPCDLFGTHLGTTAWRASESPEALEEAGRYYATIMSPFAANIRKHLARLSAYDPVLIAPSHGPVWDEPRAILDAYRSWTDGRKEDRVVVAFVSMHDSTRLLARRLVERLAARGIAADLYDLATCDIGKLAWALLGAPTLLLGSPTVLGGAHPSAVHAAALINALRPALNHVGIFGSFGWGGKMVEQLTGILTNIKVDLLDPLLLRGVPRPSDEEAITRWIDSITEKHAALGCRAR